MESIFEFCRKNTQNNINMKLFYVNIVQLDYISK